MNKMITKRMVAGGAVFAMLASVASADIVGYTNASQFEYVDPSTYVTLDLNEGGVLEDDVLIYVIDEGVFDYSFDTGPLDYIYDGTAVGSPPTLQNPTGTYKVHSYLLHWDPKTASVNEAGGILFDEEILGFWGARLDLNATDDSFNPGNIIYEKDAGRGTGFGNEADSFVVFTGDTYGENGDRLTLLQLNISDPSSYIDELRVLTLVPIPEPSTVAMLGLVGFSAVLAGRKRFQKNRKATV